MNIVITGCSRGIGLELVRLYSKQHNVYCLTRNIAPLEFLKSDSEGHGKIHCLEYDIVNGNKEELVRFLNMPEGIHIVINNAGYLVNAPFSDITENDLRSIYDVNVLAPFRLIQSLMPQLIKGKAHIINIGSMGGVQGSVKFPGLSAYSSSKGALAILTECLAEEYKESGLKFNCLALGAVQTEMLQEAFPGYIAPVSPEEMAIFIYDFSLNGGAFINGKVIPVSISTP